MPRIIFASQLSTFSVPEGAVPASVVITDSAGVEIFRNSYHTTLPFNIYGLPSVFNRDLRAKSASSGDYTISVSRPASGGSQPVADEQQLTVIHCELWRDASVDAGDFLKKNFLLEANEIVVPAALASDIPLEIWTEGYESCKITQMWTDDGRQQSAVMSYPVAPGGDTIVVYAAFAREHAPMAVLLECGQRRAVVKFTADGGSPEETRAFTFRNMFNAVETVWITGVLSESPSAQKTTAGIGGVFKVLDIDDETSYTLQAAELPLPSALRARRMLFSRETTVSHLLDYGHSQPIAVTDVSGNISDDRSQLCDLSVKFTTLSLKP